MNAIERKIQTRLESIEEYEEFNRRLERSILEERDGIIRHLSGCSSPHHVIQCVYQAAENIRSFEKSLNINQQRLTSEYRKLVEIYKEMEA